MATGARRSALSVFCLLASGGMAVWWLGTVSSTFVVAPKHATPSAALRGSAAMEHQQALPFDMLALGMGAGLLDAQPAQAYGIFYDELVPYASVTVFTIIWGIVLGFVLLRLQEAFPE
mmetsp:Transcript_90051/g.179127  ORF Transcript_90051/g.179127 Transcript_90051/m.179127 type:complete len:118 (-) Transcript_90051:63-416(-)